MRVSGCILLMYMCRIPKAGHLASKKENAPNSENALNRWGQRDWNQNTPHLAESLRQTGFLGRADSRKRAGIAEGSLVAGNRAHRALELGSGDRGPLKNPRQAERASVGLEGRKKLSATVLSVSTVQRFPWPAGCAKG